MDEASVEGEATSFIDDVSALHVQWDALLYNAKQHLSFDRFMSQKWEHCRGHSDVRPKKRNSDLKQATNELTLTHFDRSGKVTARTWVYKLDK